MEDIEEIKKEFDECVKDAIAIGRKYMKYGASEAPDMPTKEEWKLALTLFNKRIKRTGYGR